MEDFSVFAKIYIPRLDSWHMIYAEDWNALFGLLSDFGKRSIDIIDIGTV